MHTFVLQQAISVVLMESLVHLPVDLSIPPDCLLQVREMFLSFGPKNLKQKAALLLIQGHL